MRKDEMKMDKAAQQAEGLRTKQSAIKFVVLIGLVSLFADMTYEGARSITGQYLAVLGASATVVGLVAGVGEFIGYGLRLVSGYISDKTRQYWMLTIIGYMLNLFAVPLLALVGRWDLAAALMILERIGKAIRTPARDAMLSHATRAVGSGWGFGLHEAMDQVGAMLGPVIVAAVLYLKGGYETSFGILVVPALLAITVLLTARYFYPNPRDLEVGYPKLNTKGFAQVFWLYLGAVALIAFGYADFPLIAFHFKKVDIAPDQWLPTLYALAMGVDALAALAFGRLFDRIGIAALALGSLLTAWFAPLVFYGGLPYAVAGMVLWGIGMGAQESIMRASIAEMVPIDKRGTAYGIFNTGYGVCWFLGSALMGYLYDVSLMFLVVFSVVVQLASIPLFLKVRRRLTA
ncbi:major facilitator superfamily MFS_1 [Syntrophothermus lipocalidus DSM 12680]|uniref:Major facilitator superfamily MFS_1 n=2 Tax=Syntrophothermus TaxID=129001 RepID=D7CK93_SYNLT|nr:major facilitator superfamily MFS_1 [Syntrophothermus lipocalidus DSM 12680]